MKNQFQKIPFLLPAIFFIVLCGIYVFLSTAIRSNNQKAEDSTLSWQAETDRRYEIRSLDRSMPEISADKVELENHFAKSSDAVPFLDTIEKLAKDAGTVAIISTVNVVPDSTALEVDLNDSGSFEGIYRFLTLLENSPYELDFPSVDIHRLSSSAAPVAGASNFKWEASLKIKLLSFTP